MNRSFSRRTTLSWLATAAVTSGAWAQTPGSAAARPIRLTFPLPQDTLVGRTMKMFAEQVAQLSKGKMAVELLPRNGDGKLADAKGSAVPALLDGRVDMILETSTALPTSTGVKGMELWDMPFMFQNTQEVDAILDGPVGQKVLAKLGDKGIMGLVYLENGFRNITNSTRPITSPDDLKGLTIRIIDSPIYRKIFEAMGASTKAYPLPKIYAAIQAKELDGQENPLSIIQDTKLYEVQKYLSIVNYVYQPVVMMANQKWWNTLTQEDRKMLTAAATTTRDYQRNETRRANAEAQEFLKNKGMVINTLSRDAVRRFETRLSKVSSGIASDVGMDLWIEANNALTEIRSRH